MLIIFQDVVMWAFWAIIGTCIAAPMMALSNAYAASHVGNYHHRGRHLQERQYYIRRSQWYSFVAIVTLLLVGYYLFLV